MSIFTRVFSFFFFLFHGVLNKRIVKGRKEEIYLRREESVNARFLFPFVFPKDFEIFVAIS